MALTVRHDVFTPFAEVAHAVVRIGVGLLFMQHGVQKIFGLLGGRPVPLGSLMGVAGLLELIGGGLIVLGLFTRPVAVLLTLEMLGAYAMAHLPRGWVPLQNGGEPALLFALAFLFLAAHGAGRFSLDAAFRRRRFGAARVDGVNRRARVA